MARVLALIAIVMPVAALAQPSSATPPPQLTLYKNVGSAACTDDATVWVDPDARVYYLKGEGSFGKTRRGGYNCRKHADAAGYRAFAAARRR